MVNGIGLSYFVGGGDYSALTENLIETVGRALLPCFTCDLAF